MNSVRIERALLETHATTVSAALLVAVAIGWFVFGYGYIEDDGFIHLEFARSLAEGHGFAFNGHVVYGDTAPLWALFLAGIHSLGLGWVASAKLACAAGLLVAASGSWRLARQLAGDDPALLPLPAAVLMVTVLNPYFAHWSFSGMESLAALGLSLWAISLALVESPGFGRCLLASALLGIGPLLRPEFVLLDAIAGPLLLLRFWQASAKVPLAQRMLAVAALGSVMALPVMTWSAYAWQTFGAIVPNTNQAKQGGTIRELAPRLLSVYALGFPVTLALLPFVTLPRLARWRAPMAISVLLLWPLACIGFYLADHTLLQTRYSLLSMPSMSIAVLWLIADLRRPRLFAGVVAVMACCAVVTISLIVVPHIINKQKHVEVLARVSAYLREKIPAQAPVAVYAIGEIAFESRHPLVDTGGITDHSVIPHMADFAETLAWAKAHGARYFVTAAPPEPGAVAVFTASVPYIGWTFDRSRYESEVPLSLYRLP